MTREVTVGDHQEKDNMETIDDLKKRHTETACGIKQNTENVSPHTCPNCGYCPHCGRGGHILPQYPYIPSWPWFNNPYTTWMC